MKPRNPSRVRWKRLAVGGLAALVLLFAVRRILDPQPRFQGRTVESWLQQTAADSSQSNEIGQARLVLNGMGKEAVPYLIKALGRRDSALLKRCIALRNALPSVLKKMLLERADPDAVRWSAGYELRGNDYTREFLPEILKLLDDSDPGVRLDTSFTVLALMKRLDSAASLDTTVIPSLCRTLRNDDAYVRYAATAVILRMGSNAVGAAPNLVQLLNDTNVAFLAAHALVAVHEPDFRTKLPTGIVARIEKLLTDETNRLFSNVTNR